MRTRRVDIVFDDRRVLAVDHEDALLDFDSLDVIDEGRKRIESELLEIAVSLRMHGAGILVGREVVGRPSITSVSSIFERRTKRPTGGFVAAVSRP